MEEKKVNAAEAAKKAVGAAKDSERMSYEQLNNVAMQLSQQNRQLAERVRQMEEYVERANVSNLFSYLQFLFEAVKNPVSFDGDFIVDCTERIQKCMSMLGGVLMPEESGSEDAGNDGSEGQEA